MNTPDNGADCIFCAIASNRQPASFVHQEQDWIAVMDIHPIRRGHVLIIPRRHVARISELSPAAHQTLFGLADRILRAQEAIGLARGGGNLLLNDGIAANQHIPHLHLHCIPRRPGDTIAFGARLLTRTFGLFGAKTGRVHLDAIADDLAHHVGADA